MEILCPDHAGIISTKHDASHIIKAMYKEFEFEKGSRDRN